MRRGWLLTSSYKELNREVLGLLDAIFSASSRPVSIRSLSKLLGLDKGKTIEIVNKYMEKFNSLHEGIKIRRKNDFYYLTISEKYLLKIKNYMKPPPLTDRQKTILAYIYHKREIPQRELSKIFGPTVYRDLRKLRTLGFVSILKKNGIKHVIFRDEAEAYIIRRRGGKRIKPGETKL